MCFFDADDLSHARGHLSRFSIYVSVYLSQYFPGGVIVVAATPEKIPAAVQRLKPPLGYRFLGVHRADLFIASSWVRALTLRQQPGTPTTFHPSTPPRRALGVHEPAA